MFSICSSGLRPITLVAALAIVCAGCGASHAGTSPSASTTPASAMTATAGLPPLTSTDDGAIRRAYRVFFAGRTTPGAAAAQLQHGSSFLASLRDQAGSQQAGSLSARVTSVSRDPAHPSADVAKLSFALQSNGTTLLPGATGYAVRVSGRWLVAARTYCELIELQGTPPTQCHNTSITALP